MTNRSSSFLLVAIVFLGILVGVVGGGVMGGIAAYYVVLSRAPALTASEAISVSAADEADQRPAPVTNVTLNQTSAVIEAVKKVEPAVVTVVNRLNRQTLPFSRIAPTASGSGIIVDAEGHIITNDHVVQDASELQVILKDGSTSQVHLVGTNPVSDVAVLQLDG